MTRSMVMWAHKVGKEAETMTLDEMLMEVMAKERERAEEERESVMWFGSYNEAMVALRV